VVAAGLDEAEHMTEWYGLHSATMQPLRQAASETWGPHRAGMALDAVATVANVMLCCASPKGLRRR
jgi:hypothetical protein